MSVVAKIKKLIAENPKDKAEWSFVAKKTLVALLFLYHKSTKLTSQREKVYQTLGIVEKPKENKEEEVSAIERALSLLEPKYTKLLIKEFIDNDYS